jgi:hypothetical protein
MSTKRIFSLTTGLLVAGMIGCDGADQRFEQTEQEIITEPALETMEVEVLTEDTLLVEETIETRINVDTTRIDGDEVPAGAVPGTTTPRTGTNY